VKTTIIPAAPGWRRVYKLDGVWPETLKEAEPILGWQVFESDGWQFSTKPVTLYPVSEDYAIIDPDGKVHVRDEGPCESWGEFRAKS
jgi:hypothetical protein